MRHAKVTQAPSKSAYHIFPAGREQACSEIADHDFSGSIRILIYVVQKRRVQILRSCDYDGYGQKSDQHENPLEEVGPAYSLETAKECISYNYKSKDYFTTTNPQTRMNENKEFSDMINKARQLMK